MLTLKITRVGDKYTYIIEKGGAVLQIGENMMRIQDIVDEYEAMLIKNSEVQND